MKKTFFVCISIIMLLSLWGCSRQTFSVSYISCADSVCDDNQSQEIYEDISGFCESYGIEKTLYNAYNEQIKENAFISSGNVEGGIVISHGSETYDLAEKYADENSDKSYIVVGAKEYEESLDNLLVINFREEEIAFIAGYIAANVTQTGKVGFIGSVENASTKAYENGFAAGVYYAGRNTECYTEYIGSFNDPIKGGEVAEDMMQDGVDIIYHAAGTSGLGIVDAVKEKDKYVIGSGMDQSYLAKENVIASTVKDTSSLLKDIIIEAKEETHSTLSGMRYYGISEGVLHMEYNGDVVSQSLKTRVEMISNKIISEEIEIPATDVQLEIFKDNF